MHRSTSAFTATLLALTVVLSVLAGSAVAGVAASPSNETQTSATVTFDDQTSGGTTVVVDEVAMPDGGFVAIHDGTLEEGGEHVFSSVAGSSAYLPPGTHEDVEIQLDEPVSEDTTLIAMPHKDTDGDRAYAFVSSNGEADGPYTKGGDIVVDPASITTSATVSFSDQPSDGEYVVVDSVELSSPGFIAIHDSTLLDGKTFDSVRGAKFLPAGHHENVRVQLDPGESLTENDTLIPMPHKDTNGNQQYDFVPSEGAEDGPFVNGNGDIVLTTGNVSVGVPASATFEPQVSGGNLVIVDSVFVPEGGFVTAHDSTVLDGKTFESVRGTSEHLEPGLHRNVHITLDEPLQEDDTIVAMPHKDTNDNQKYDFVTGEGKEDGPYTNDGDIVVDPGEVTTTAAVSISDQTSDGRTLVVHHVDLSEGGFVTIHDASLQGGAVFDSVRGSSEYLDAGFHADVEVTLDDPLRESATVIAMPHKDTNDNQQYDFVTGEGSEDGPFTDGDGNIVVDPARASVNAQATFEAQEGSDTLVVQSVTMHDGGFVTIHDATLLDGAVFDSVRGTSEYLGPGTHENVEIQLDQPVEEDGTFIAMPHKDTNDNQQYDFVTDEGAQDGPYVAKGKAVVAPGQVTAQVSAATPTDAEDEMSDGGQEPTPTDGGAPGFGVVAALLAALAAAALVRRR